MREPDGNDVAMWCGPNDGGIKRGDRADTGDEEARPTDGVSERGSGVWGGADPGPSGHPTGTGENWDPQDSLLSGVADESYDRFDTPENQPRAGEDLGDLTVLDADDPTLGLTNIGDKPAEDWAADTGPTHSNEEMDHTKTP